MTTEQRLGRLERENRWMKAGGVMAMAGVVAVLVVVLLPAGDLVARSLTLEDEDGTPRARLHLLGLELADAKGREWAALSSTGLMGPTLVLDGEGEREHVSLGALGLSFNPGFTLFASGLTPSGRELGPTLVLTDGSNSTAELTGTGFTLYDGNGESRVVLGVPRFVTAENTLTMYDAEGKVIWKAPKD